MNLPKTMYELWSTYQQSKHDQKWRGPKCKTKQSAKHFKPVVDTQRCKTLQCYAPELPLETSVWGYLGFAWRLSTWEISYVEE